MDPRAAVMDDEGNLFVLERNGNALSEVRHPDGKIYTLAGTGKKGKRDGPGFTSDLSMGRNISALIKRKNIIIADDNNNCNPPIRSQNQIRFHNPWGQSQPQDQLLIVHTAWPLLLTEAIWVCDSWNNRVLTLRNY